MRFPGYFRKQKGFSASIGDMDIELEVFPKGASVDTEKDRIKSHRVIIRYVWTSMHVKK
jgi:hypothetical protein